MDFVEASNIDLHKEAKHWWIKTRFQYLDLAISHLETETFSVLEVGCGTGQNLAYLRNYSPARDRVDSMVGIDLNLPEDFKRDDLSSKDKLINGEDEIPEGEKYDLLILMDVIEHVEDPVSLMRTYLKYIKPRGKVLITVPAFQSLWSQHDVILEHIKRYDKELLNREAHTSGLRKLRSGYIFSLFFPVVYLIRKTLKKNEKEVETDLKLPNPIVNKICLFLGWVERIAGNPLPFGTSVFGIYENRQ